MDGVTPKKAVENGEVITVYDSDEELTPYEEDDVPSPTKPADETRGQIPRIENQTYQQNEISGSQKNKDLKEYVQESSMREVDTISVSDSDDEILTADSIASDTNKEMIEDDRSNLFSNKEKEEKVGEEGEEKGVEVGGKGEEEVGEEGEEEGKGKKVYHDDSDQGKEDQVDSEKSSEIKGNDGKAKETPKNGVDNVSEEADTPQDISDGVFETEVSVIILSDETSAERTASNAGENGKVEEMKEPPENGVDESNAANESNAMEEESVEVSESHESARKSGKQKSKKRPSDAGDDAELQVKKSKTDDANF